MSVDRLDDPQRKHLRQQITSRRRRQTQDRQNILPFEKRLASIRFGQLSDIIRRWSRQPGNIKFFTANIKFSRFNIKFFRRAIPVTV